MSGKKCEVHESDEPLEPYAWQGWICPSCFFEIVRLGGWPLSAVAAQEVRGRAIMKRIQAETP